MKERVRFSPSPSGALHLGGARTALYNWLLARKTGGQFILRIEDTNPTAIVAGSEEAIMEDLRWLGLDWDEGPDVGGPYAPYRQSERTEQYRASLQTLREAGFVYPCFCSPEQLASDRAQDEVAGKPPRYHGRCRDLSAAEVQVRIREGQPHTWRFAVRGGDPVTFTDAVFGPVTISRSDIGDFVVARADGGVTYDLACVTDDIAMKCTTVLRGADHLTNTARQLLLYEALSARPPRFGHVPLVTSSSGAPLSKSTGAESIAALREAGHVPSAVVQHVALLGWSDPNRRQVLTLQELVDTFDFTRVSRAPAGHDPARLDALTVRHLHTLSDEELCYALAPFVPPVPEWLDVAAFERAVRDDLARLTDITAFLEMVSGTRAPAPDAVALLQTPEAQMALKVVRSALAEMAENASGQEREAAVRAAAKAAGIALGVALPALRAALTGVVHGLPVALLLTTIPPRVVLERVDRASGCLCE